MEEKDKRRIVIEVSEDARARLKAVAARRRLTMRELIDELAARVEQESFGAAVAAEAAIAAAERASAPITDIAPVPETASAPAPPDRETNPRKPSRPGIDDFVGRTMDFEEFIKLRRGVRGQ